jgi:Tfp pilus assembly protein PilO
MNTLTAEKKQHVILVAVLTGVVIALAWFLLIGTLQDNIAKKRAKAGETADKVADARKKISQSAALEEQLASATRKLAATEDEGMASGDLYFWIINTISRFKLAYRVDIPVFSQPEEIKATVLPDLPYKSVRYNVRGSAYYHDLGRFVAAFENSHPYVFVQNLEVFPSDVVQADDPERLNFRMDIVALVKPTAIASAKP